MTRIIEEEFTCCVCGTISKHKKVASTNARGFPDLDNRPPEQKRSTISYLNQRCPGCGYCSNNISKCEGAVDRMVKSVDYQNIVNDKSMPELAASFMALAYEKGKVNRFLHSARCAIHAAWACDDKKDSAAAIKCRLEAIAMIEQDKSQAQNISKKTDSEEVITIDLMRRVGMFKEAMDLADKILIQATEKITIQLIEFEKELINKKDVAVHKVSEALHKD